MAESPTTVVIQGCLDRLQAGDRSAREELLQLSARRLNALARTMLKHYARVRRWEDSDDVFQNASIRLLRALEQVTPQTARDFYRLAALQIRRELLDLARHYYGPLGQGARHDSVGTAAADPSREMPAHVPSDMTLEPAGLAGWTEFHATVEKLDPESKEVFDLIWYQGLPQEEAAGLLNISLRTVKRRWQTARLKLHEALGGQPPSL
jgi:RNA polymerase sigma-70 factor (ECF subfamily)